MRGRLSQELEDVLLAMTTSRAFSKGATLYLQDTPSAGIYMVESGSVLVMLPTGDNDRQLVEVVGAGTILGLSESLSESNYRVTAEAAELTSTLFIERESFLKALDDHHEICMQVVRLLSENLHGLYHKFRRVSAHPGRPRRRSPSAQY
jgi:CRP-like cAMP-binding protein